jgi:hypothetical protein
MTEPQEYVPTTGDMQEQFVAGAMVTGFAYSRDEAREDWGSWLEAHDAEQQRIGAMGRNALHRIRSIHEPGESDEKLRSRCLGCGRTWVESEDEPGRYVKACPTIEAVGLDVWATQANQAEGGK